MSNEECRKRTTPNAPIKDFTTLCAYSGKEGTGICQGKNESIFFNFFFFKITIILN